jgi:hypothetical protein
MTTVLDTVTDVEDKVVEAVASAQEPVVDAVKKLADYVAGILPEDRPSLPFADQLPTASEVVETQFAFAKKMLDVQYKFAKALVEAAAPVVPATPVSKPRVATKKAAA